MKKLTFSLLLLLTIGFVSCQNDDVVDESAFINVSELENDKSIIKELGFDVSTLVDRGDYYLVEGDIGLIKKNLKQHLAEFKGDSYESSKTKQGYFSGRLVSLDNAKSMSVRIDASVPVSGTGSDWRSAVQTAINAWNNISGSCIYFYFTTSSTADITVRREYSSGGEYARVSDFPLNQKPSKEIVVNSMHDNGYAYKANTLIHEMGHTIGFLHTHYTPAQQGGVLVPNTPTIDDNSIMSYNRDRSLIPGFSSNDIAATKFLYPVLPTDYIPIHVGYVKVGDTFSIPLNGKTVQGYAASFLHLGSGQFRVEYISNAVERQVLGEIATWDSFQRKQFVYRIFYGN